MAAGDIDDHPPSKDLSKSPSCLENPQNAAQMGAHSPVNSSPSALACLASPPSSSAKRSPFFAHGSSYVDVLKGLTHQPILKPLVSLRLLTAKSMSNILPIQQWLIRGWFSPFFMMFAPPP
ncbi:hypothetical protein Salat_2726700 [Sesamum alatum]|uniref:Uncharacterized protein n=1 Tax=Sesamum alatum TaxID=300844 RepID=A0AAE1XKJ7_9LAMI|nr:hypothetical protein Salat_2726700 [Sesamum alatum]